MIGVDIGEKLIKIVELKESPQGLMLSRYAMVEVLIKLENETNAQAQAHAIASALKDFGFEGKEAFTNISGPKVQVRRIVLPPMPASELTEAVKFEIKNDLNYPISSAVLDYYLLGKSESQGGKQELLVVTVNEESLKDRVAILEQAGLKCIGVTIAPFAILQIIKQSPQVSKDDLVALVNIGESSSNFDIFQNNTLQFTREITIAGANITESLAQNLKLDFADAEVLKVKHGIPDEGETSSTPEGISLADVRQIMLASVEKLQAEISASLNYFREHFGGGTISHIFVAGGSIRLKNLKELLNQHLGIPVSMVDPSLSLSVDQTIDPIQFTRDLPHLPLAIGLALSKGMEINLLKIEQNKTDKNKTTQKLQQILDRIQIPTAAVVAAFVVLLALIIGLNFFLVRSMEKTKNELDANKIKLDRLTKFRDRKLAFEDITKKEIDVKLLLARINSLMPQGVTLAFLDFNKVNRSVELSGESLDPQAASNFHKRVEESAYFSQSKLLSIRKIGDTIIFKMRFNIR
ncbi:MAG: type IV pilus assembly protein PilM [Candidatus Margulisiibacteriota bacterium]